MTGMRPIQTSRLLLRRFTPGDAVALFDYLHRPAVDCFLSLQLADLDAAARMAYDRSGSEEWVAICLREDGRLIGDLYVMADKDADTFSVGWNLNPRFAGAGYASEATQALLEDLFGSGKARRVFAWVETDNLASQRLCHKLGMRLEGTFKAFTSFRNDPRGEPVYVDTQQYALLREEWRQTGPVCT